jgi:hypothetical protein
MGGWHWNRSNLSGIEDALIVEPSDPEPRGNLPAIPPAHKPRANAPDEQQYIPLYQQSEARILNFILEVFPSKRVKILRAGDGGTVADDADQHLGGSLRCDAFGAVAEYLYALIAEDRRPLVWIERAKDKLQEIADLLLTWQAGGPFQAAGITTALARATTSSHLNYGAIQVPDNQAAGTWSLGTHSFFSREVAGAGIVFLRAWQVFGEEKYRHAYRLCMTFLRRAQCPGYLDTQDRWVHPGGDENARRAPCVWPSSWSKSSGAAADWVPSTTSKFMDLYILDFLAAVKAEEGDLTYGDATAVGQFASATTGTTSEMAEAAIAFWRDGTYDRLDGAIGTPLVPGTTAWGAETYWFSIVHNGTAVDSFSGSLSTYKTPWTRIILAEWAGAMRGWINYAGFDSTMQTLWNYFRASTQGAATEIEDFDDPAVKRSWWYMYPTRPQGDDFDIYEMVGTYDPTLCWAVEIQIYDTPDYVNYIEYYGGYYWPTVGMLASTWSTQDPVKFKQAKEELSKGVPRHVAPEMRDGEFQVYKSLMGFSGLSMQPFHAGYEAQTSESLDGLQVWYDVYAAAWCGMAYRYAPKIYTQKDHP